jgi:hypothetical protein
MSENNYNDNSYFNTFKSYNNKQDSTFNSKIVNNYESVEYDATAKKQTLSNSNLFRPIYYVLVKIYHKLCRN